MHCALVRCSLSEDKCFQLTFEIVVANVRKSQVRWQAVPQMRSGCSKTSVTVAVVFLEQCMFWCLRNEAGDGHFQTAGECRLPGTPYIGALPDNDWYTRHASLNVTRWRTGSQCNWRRTGVMWSQCFVPVMRRAAAFWTDQWPDLSREALQQRVTTV